MVREDLVVKFFSRLVGMCDEFCQGKGDKAYVNATLILLLSRFTKNLETSTAGYILDLCEQQFRIGAMGNEEERRKVMNLLTPGSEVTGNLGIISQKLLDHYVEMEGFALSQVFLLFVVLMVTRVNRKTLFFWNFGVKNWGGALIRTRTNFSQWCSLMHQWRLP